MCFTVALLSTIMCLITGTYQTIATLVLDYCFSFHFSFDNCLTSKYTIRPVFFLKTLRAFKCSYIHFLPGSYLTHKKLNSITAVNKQFSVRVWIE